MTSVARQKSFSVIGIRTSKPRYRSPEKRLAKIALRCPDNLKTSIEHRAASKNITLSQHIYNLAVADLCAQRKTGQTLSDAAREIMRAAQLAIDGIASDSQKLWLIKRAVAFEIAVLNAA